MGPVLGLVESGKCMVGQLWVFHWISLEYRFFPFLFFYLSGWATNILLYSCTFVQNLAHGARVCALRSQESVYGN